MTAATVPATVLTVVLVTALAACGAGPGQDATDRRTVETLLSRVLTVPRRTHVLGYSRDEFGGWSTRVSSAGRLCTTRDLVLFRTFGNPADPATDSPVPGCPTARGEATDVYTGERFTPVDTEIDHVVPLAAAWDHGAHTWTRARRTAFANDIELNLIAVSTQANQSKSDGTPSEWLPSAEWPAACAYSARYLTVAVTYSLTVSTGDADAARDSCLR